METENALEKLAKQLKSYSCQGPVLYKAQSIIEELAKVQIADGMSRKAIARGNCLDYKCNGGFPETVGIFTTEHFPKWICSAVNAIEKCREIAKKK